MNPDHRERLRRWSRMGIVVLSLVVYVNSLGCDFVFDDISAIKDNKDLRPDTAWTSLLYNDFWGTPMVREHSHKSYRPVCVFTFRLNYLLHQLSPAGYHAANVMLHAAVCLLFHFTLQQLGMEDLVCGVSGLLFAVHPVHTEAVTGVVGRAELLSSLFFLSTLLIYKRLCEEEREPAARRMCLYVALFVSVSLAMLSKEQGLTVLAVCLVYDAFICRKVHLSSWQWTCVRSHLRAMLERAVMVGLMGLILMKIRLSVVMGSTLPVFTHFDNPASHESFPTKHLTWAYLLAKNAAMLLYPSSLCCDWTMGSVPLVTSLADPRNLITLFFLLVYLHLLVMGLMGGRQGDAILMALSLLTLPFLPASNLFFPVGFVLAERVLYLPSMGFCLAVAVGWCRCCSQKKLLMVCCLGVVVASHCAKTVLRNRDWTDEMSLFKSGLKVNANNAKLWNNVGHAYEAKSQYDQALRYFQKAALIQPDDVGAHINVGRTYNNLGQYELAENTYLLAKSLLPKPIKGQKYTARIPPQHLSVFLNLANLVARDPQRLAEADLLYRQAISMRADYVQAYINRGDVLIKMGRLLEAKDVYEAALAFDPANADLHYNLGVVHIELAQMSQAQTHFATALQVDKDHIQSLMNSAILMQETGDAALRPLAYQRLFRVLELSKESAHYLDRVYFNLGMLAMDEQVFDKAEIWFKQAIEHRPSFRSALFNLALLLNEQKRPLDALPVLNQLMTHHPDHIKGLVLLGDIYTNHVRNLDAAESCYKRIIQLDPAHIQARHNLCVVLVEQDHLQKAKECLLQVLAMAPEEQYIKRHLQIVQSRIRAAAASSSSSSSPDPEHH